MTATSRVRRHQLILDLTSAGTFRSQEALAAALAERGHRVTQSTLSRDLKELRVSRIPQRDGYRYLPASAANGSSAPSTSLTMARITAAEVLDVSANEVCVVLRTQAGRAQGVGAYLDDLDLADVLATVAGDDTVLVIPASVERCAALSGELATLFDLSTDRGRAQAPRRPTT